MLLEDGPRAKFKYVESLTRGAACFKLTISVAALSQRARPRTERAAPAAGDYKA